MSSLCLMLIKSSWLNSGLELAFLTRDCASRGGRNKLCQLSLQDSKNSEYYMRVEAEYTKNMM